MGSFGILFMAYGLLRVFSKTQGSKHQPQLSIPWCDAKHLVSTINTVGKARLMGRSRLSSGQAEIPGFPRTKVSPHLSENVFGQWSTGHVHQDQLRAQMRQQDPRVPQGWRQNAPPSPRALSDSGAPLHSRDAVSSPIRAPSPLHQQPPLVPRLHFGHSREGLHDSQSWEPKAQSTPTEGKSVDGSTSGDSLQPFFGAVGSPTLLPVCLLQLVDRCNVRFLLHTVMSAPRLNVLLCYGHWNRHYFGAVPAHLVALSVIQESCHLDAHSQ